MIPMASVVRRTKVFRRSLAVLAWTMLVIAFFTSFWVWWTGDVIPACPAIGKSCDVPADRIGNMVFPLAVLVWAVGLLVLLAVVIARSNRARGAGSQDDPGES